MEAVTGETKMDDDFLKIDKLALDDEWVRQPSLYFSWAERAAKARRDWDEAKSSLEVVTAELDDKVRSNPGLYCDGKLTEKVVEKSIVREKEYLEAVASVNKAKHRYEIASAVVSALEHKKAALGKLVDLFLASYYAEPKSRRRDSNEEMEEMSKRQVRSRGKNRD